LELETRVQFPCCSHLFFPADARPRRGTTHAREAQLQLREHPAAAARSIPTPLTHSLCVGTRATLRSPEERKVPQPFEEKAKKNRKQKTENRKQRWWPRWRRIRVTPTRCEPQSHHTPAPHTRAREVSRRSTPNHRAPAGYHNTKRTRVIISFRSRTFF
jgi:hypothetical protein